MSIVVVKKNSPPPPEVWAGTCAHCGSKLECFEADLSRLTRNASWGADPTPEKSKPSVGDCPVCHSRAIEFRPTGRTELSQPDPAFVTKKPTKPRAPARNTPKKRGP